MLFAWEWLGPGGLPGLQNLWRAALRAAVGSTPIHSRLLCADEHWTMDHIYLSSIAHGLLSNIGVSNVLS
jgi:hypothetical protein